MAVALPPLDGENAAVERHVHLAVAEATAMRGDGGRARTGAASAGDTRAAFPYPHTQTAAVLDRDEFDIDPGREHLVRLDTRTEFCDWRRVGIGFEQNAMRIAY